MRACYIGLALCAVMVCCDASCEMANWRSSFDKKGFSTCGSVTQYMNGLYRNKPSGYQGIFLIEQARCCARPRPYWNQATSCIMADWWSSFDRNNRWNTCPNGYFLRGLYRNDGQSLDNIEVGKCCKPANHPHWYGHCYDQDVRASFDKEGTSKCRDGYFMTGLYRGNCDEIYCIEMFKCCKMVPTPPKMQSLDDVKTRVMDETMAELALLAHYLGYGWCASCRAQSVGEDFRRNGDSWEADRKGPCNGYMNHHRLKMHYRDFKFGVKNIVYGKPVIQTLKPQSYISGSERNNEDHEVTRTVSEQVESTRTVTHTTTSSWKKTHGVGIELSYTPPDATGGVGVKASYNFNYEKSSTQTDSTANTQKYTSTVTSTKTLKPFTAAQYRILLTKTRTTVPYTATIIVHFSAELDGFLRWGGGKDGDSTNYHYEHRGSNRRPTFKYKFGDSSTPFYSALKKQSDRSMRPWEWHEMKARYSHAQTLINALTDESKYEFTLTGQFEDVIGHHVDIHWSTTSLKVPRGLERTLAETHFPKIKRTSSKRVFPKPPEERLSMSKPHILPLLLNINYDDPDNNVHGNMTDPPRVFPTPPKVDISIKEPQKIPHVPNVEDESELNK
ncbi:uncharacterized protein LOC5514381 [Nematostella vectensis]|uniref:uncharacterized protein LOC5514381 n=1 Tax=Nematostella vectensis TaxID=45351 RepID=UPI002076F252|nr:uncharacterized protein LOC5514381 [Nematostella vectensis]